MLELRGRLHAADDQHAAVIQAHLIKLSAA
jgi:hypothetical protein